MAENKHVPANIDEYIAQFPPAVQETMNRVRAVIKEAVPGAVEKISYGMPAFADENGNLVWFAVWKRHFSLYPVGPDDEPFKDRLAGFKGTKGSVHFPLDQPVPYELIQEMALYRAEENREKAQSSGKRTGA